MNTCAATQQFFDALIRGTLSDGEAYAVRAHMAACDECREAYELELLLTRAATCAPVLEPSPGFAERVADAWCEGNALAVLSPYEVLSKAVHERMRSIFDPIVEPFLPVCRETSTTLSVARGVLREASGVVIAALKQVLFGRYMPEAT